MARKSATNRRVLKKKKSKSEKAGAASATSKLRFASKKRSGGTATHGAVRRAPLEAKHSVLLKKQAQERMVLKEHLADLRRKRVGRVRGDDAKQERRQMGKYMKQLRAQQISKHATEIGDVEAAQRAAGIAPRSGPGSHLPPTTHRRKQLRYLSPATTVGLPHGKSHDGMQTPTPSNVAGNVNLLVASQRPSYFTLKMEAQQQQQAAAEGGVMFAAGSARGEPSSNNTNADAAPARSFGGRQPHQQQASNVQSQQLSRNRWVAQSGGGAGAGDAEDEWIDVEDGAAAQSANQLRRLFAGFGGATK